MVDRISMQQFELLVLRVKNEMPDSTMSERLDELQARLKRLEKARVFF